jgi:hypothetical protein
MYGASIGTLNVLIAGTKTPLWTKRYRNEIIEYLNFDNKKFIVV